MICGPFSSCVFLFSDFIQFPVKYTFYRRPQSGSEQNDRFLLNYPSFPVIALALNAESNEGLGFKSTKIRRYKEPLQVLWRTLWQSVSYPKSSKTLYEDKNPSFSEHSPNILQNTLENKTQYKILSKYSTKYSTKYSLKNPFFPQEHTKYQEVRNVMPLTGSRYKERIMSNNLEFVQNPDAVNTHTLRSKGSSRVCWITMGS